MVDIFTARRDLLYEGLNDLPHIRCLKPEATFYMLLNISATGLTSLVFAQKLLQEARVAVVPGVAYGKSCDKYVRMAFTLNEDRIKEGIRRIRHFVEEM